MHPIFFFYLKANWHSSIKRISCQPEIQNLWFKFSLEWGFPSNNNNLFTKHSINNNNNIIYYYYWRPRSLCTGYPKLKIPSVRKQIGQLIQVQPRSWTRDYMEQIQQVVREGLELRIATSPMPWPIGHADNNPITFWTQLNQFQRAESVQDG